MARVTTTAAEADAIIAATKIIAFPVEWRAEPAGWRLTARTFIVPLREWAEVRGYIGRINHSFVLLYRKQPIRKYTKHFEHRYGRFVYDRPHKHRWDEVHEDAEAYYPDDIDPDTDINEQFLAFCRECSIELIGGYQHVQYS